MTVRELAIEMAKYTPDAPVTVLGLEFSSDDIDEEGGTVFIDISHYCSE